MIPKIIHYCWFGYGKMNALQLECLKSWESILPDYQIKRWDESNFDVHFCEFTSSAYQEGKFAFVSDVCRLFALQQDGGIYLDLDMLLLKRLDKFLIHDFFLGYESPGRYSAGIIGVEKGSLLVHKLINEYVKIKFDSKFPVLIPDFLMNHLQAEDVVVFPEDYFYPLPFVKKGNDYISYLTLNSHTVHLWNHSWISEKELFRKYQFVKGGVLFFKNLIRFPSLRNRKYINDVKGTLITALKSYIYKQLRGSGNA